MTKRDRIVTAAVAGAVVTAFVVYRRMDDLLSAMHPPGDAAHGLGDLVPLTRGPDANSAQAILDSWLDPLVSQPGFPDAREVARSALVCDFVLAVGVPFVLLLRATATSSS